MYNVPSVYKANFLLIFLSSFIVDKKKPHIKKPLNAFMLYMKEMRAKVVAECTLKESAAINQILGRRVSVNKTVIIIVLVCIYLYIVMITLNFMIIMYGEHLFEKLNKNYSNNII